MDLSKNEEDYLKALFYLIVESENDKTSTNQLAEYLGISPASVNGMLKKLRTKKLVDYQKYGKLHMTEQGRAIAVQLVRKHRLWETFLYDKLGFSWDEVHEVAEQLEHIQSEKLIRKLDAFLEHPSNDPHGAVIPTEEGEYRIPPKKTLAEVPAGEFCKLVSVKDSSVAFLQYVTKLGLALSSRIRVVERISFDDSLIIEFDGKQVQVTRKFAENVFVV
ncbi:MAG: metal-dependent transcriptional regulator [Lewinellaceae bacterium]|nr:metal-dependent transcriptional regulator [Lewinella sp.]MCB9277914.1 metal-dependent transcriptional regulator [Lewinellaceae bacterium]